jgi:hypothetical protein
MLVRIRGPEGYFIDALHDCNVPRVGEKVIVSGKVSFRVVDVEWLVVDIGYKKEWEVAVVVEEAAR